MADDSLRSLFEDYGPQVILLGLFSFMVWVRSRPRDRVITETDVLFSGNDPWYHARMVQYAVRFFPSSPTFDPYSYFPYGTGRHSGFGGLFDQLIALGALIVGIGDPSPHLVEVVTAYAPVIFGALTIFPAYLVAKRLTNRWAALGTAIILALVNGQFLTRTIVGVSDHQSAEAFFGTLALVGFIFAVETAYREQPTWEDIRDKNWRVLRRPVFAGVLGGVAIASYLMMWGPGIFIVFTMGLFVVIQSVREHLRQQSLEYLTFATVISMLTAGILTLGYAKSYELSATAFSLLQPLVATGIALGAIVLWVLSDQFKSEQYEERYYPVAVLSIIVGGLIITYIVFPRGISLLDSLVSRVYSFGLLTSQSALTVAEIQPATLSDTWGAYTALFPIAVVGLLILAYQVIRRNRPTELLVVLWSLTIASAYFTMIRFGYYMGVTVAILAGFAVWKVIQLVELDGIREVSDLETYQILVVLILIVAVIPGNIIAVDGTSAPAWETADRLGGANTAWQSELTWVEGSTPDIPVEYYGQHERPDNGDFAYPAGAYGVMSWWDYGHWITYTGERMPNANPFQQGPRPSSAFLLAENETRANLILDALPSFESRSDIPEMSNDELRATINAQANQQANENTRYVMIDDQMAAGKFSAIATWTGPGPGTYFSRQEFQVGDEEAQLIGPNERYQNTMLAKLYLQDAQGLSHYRLVHESGQSAIVSVAQQTPQGYESTNFINQRLTSEVLAAVQQRQDLAFYDVKQPATVKTFERVPGATLTGQIDTNNATTVFAIVELQTNRNRNFTYVQSVQTDEQGNFEMTVPYATTNTVGPAEGGTDVGVEATGKYELFAGNLVAPSAQGNTSVPEPAIYEGETISVEFETVEQSTGNETDTSDGNDTSNGSNNSALGLPPGSPPSASFGTADELTASAGSPLISAEPRRAADV